MAGRFTAEPPAVFTQHFQHMAIADRGALEIDAERAHRLLEAEVAHYRAYHRAAQVAGLEPRFGDDVQQLVTVDDFAFVIDHDHAVAVAVKSNAKVGAVFEHRHLRRFGMSGTAVVIDVEAVRLDTDGDHRGTEFLEHAGRDVIGGPVRAVDHDLQTAKFHDGRDAALAEFDIAAGGVADAFGLAEVGLDRELQLVGELVALRREKFDAIIVVRIVRGANDDAGLAMQGAGEAGDGRRRHGTEQADVDARRRQPGLQRRFEHVARDAGVLADEDLAGSTLGAGQYAAGSPTELQHELGIDRRLAHFAAYAVGTEITSLARIHYYRSLQNEFLVSGAAAPCRYGAALTAAAIFTACSVAATSWARITAAPCATASAASAILP